MEGAAAVSEAPVPRPHPTPAQDAQRVSLSDNQAPLGELEDMIGQRLFGTAKKLCGGVQPRYGPSSQSMTRNHGMAPGAKPIPMQMLSLSSNHETPRSSTEDVTTLDIVKDLAQLVNIIMREKARLNPRLTRTVKQEPSKLHQKTLKDLHSADAAKADPRVLVHVLIGRRGFR